MSSWHCLLITTNLRWPCFVFACVFTASAKFCQDEWGMSQVHDFLAPLYCLRCLSFLYLALPRWVGQGRHVHSLALLPPSSNNNAVLFKHPSHLYPGLPWSGERKRGDFYRRTIASAPHKTQTMVRGLQPHFSTATVLAGAVVGAELHLWQLSLSFSSSHLPYLFQSAHLQIP